MMEKTLKEHIKNGYCNLWLCLSFPIKFINIISVFVMWLFIITGIPVLFWDSLVWLFKADWRTSEFQYPILALIVIIGAAIITAVAEAILNVIEDHLYITCDKAVKSDKE